MVPKQFPPAFLGDFRMVIGEDKSKVANIVQDNMQHFRILYTNILQDCPQVVYKPQQGKLEVRPPMNTHMFFHSKVNVFRDVHPGLLGKVLEGTPHVLLVKSLLILLKLFLSNIKCQHIFQTFLVFQRHLVGKRSIVQMSPQRAPETLTHLCSGFDAKP